MDPARWYETHCAFCGYEFEPDSPRWSFEVPENEPPKIGCLVCVWHGPAVLERLPAPA